MFALRGMAVSFSIFILLYSVLSLVVCWLWRMLFSYGRRCSARRVADMLFTLRVTPFAVATGITLALAVPSFVLLEPRAVSESLGAVPVALGLCGLGALLAGAWKAATALQQASPTVARWSRAAAASSNIHSTPSVPVPRLSAASPPLTAAGIFRPSVWFSHPAEVGLSERRLRSRR